MKSKYTTYDILYIYLLIIFVTKLQSLQDLLRRAFKGKISAFL